MGDFADIPKMPARSTLYQFIADTLLERIKAGVIPAGGALPSERELCLEFNVSRQTVRNALSALSSRGVLDSRAGAGHFVRTQRGQPERKKDAKKRSTRQIGIICSPRVYVEEPNQWSTLMGIKSRLSQEGFSVALSVSQKDEKLGFFPSYQHWLEDGNVEGYIAASVTPSLQRRLFESGYPSLSMGYVWEDIALPSLAFDFRGLYKQIVLHLASLGHSHVGVTVVTPDSIFARSVLDGVADARSHLGWPADSVSIRRFADTAYDLVSSLRSMIRSNERPSALILQGDDYLDEVLRFLEMEGIRVPEDLHVTAVQVLNRDRFTHGDRVAFYDFDYPEFGRIAAQRMLDLIAGKSIEPLHQEILLGKYVEASLAAA